MAVAEFRWISSPMSGTQLQEVTVLSPLNLHPPIGGYNLVGQNPLPPGDSEFRAFTLILESSPLLLLPHVCEAGRHHQSAGGRGGLSKS